VASGGGRHECSSKWISKYHEKSDGPKAARPNKMAACPQDIVGTYDGLKRFVEAIVEEKPRHTEGRRGCQVKEIRTKTKF